jgi:probable HAF family extracellular repeat protein
MRFRYALLLCAGLWAGTTLLAFSAQAQQPRYQFFDLGTLGGTSSFALDINNRRQITGNSQTAPGNPAPRLNAFLWENGILTNLGTLPGSNNFSRGYALNDRGVVVGESDNNFPRAFRAENGVLTDIGTLGGSSAVAHDINNQGDIVGAASNGQASRPFLYRDGLMQDLGTLSGTLNSSGRAWAVNERGDVVGVSRFDDANFRSHATLWRGGVPGSATDLGSLVDSTFFSQAFAVNNLLQIVGESVVGTTSSGSSIYNAFLWEDGTMRNLGTLAGFRHSRANDINDAGLIVGHVSGFYNFPTIDGRAVLWESGTLLDLNTVLPTGSGWILRTAEGINAYGDIVGFGSFQGQVRGYMLQAVPEPGPLAFIGTLGCIGLPYLLRKRCFVFSRTA